MSKKQVTQMEKTTEKEFSYLIQSRIKEPSSQILQRIALAMLELVRVLNSFFFPQKSETKRGTEERKKQTLVSFSASKFDRWPEKHKNQIWERWRKRQVSHLRARKKKEEENGKWALIKTQKAGFFTAQGHPKRQKSKASLFLSLYLYRSKYMMRT